MEELWFICIYILNEEAPKSIFLFPKHGYFTSAKAIASTLYFVTGDPQIHISSSELFVGLHIPVHTL